MTLLTSPSGFALRGRPARAWFLALAAAPWLVGLACGDEATAGGLSTDGESGGASAGAGGSVSGGAGSGGLGASAGGSAATAGSAGGGSNAGSGSSGLNLPDAGPGPTAGGPDASTGAFRLTSTAIDDVPGCGPGVGARDLCDLFPEENTGLNGAANVSPQFDWTGAPTGTQSFAIALHDLSNLNGASDPFTHWVMWNIPGSAAGLPASLPEGLQPGVPDANTRQVSYLESKNNGFAGSGAAGNVYEFVLFALGTPSIDPGSEDPDTVEDAIAGSSGVLGTATLRARSTPP